MEPTLRTRAAGDLRGPSPPLGRRCGEAGAPRHSSRASRSPAPTSCALKMISPPGIVPRIAAFRGIVRDLVVLVRETCDSSHGLARLNGGDPEVVRRADVGAIIAPPEPICTRGHTASIERMLAGRGSFMARVCVCACVCRRTLGCLCPLHARVRMRIHTCAGVRACACQHADGDSAHARASASVHNALVHVCLERW
jgi:hypothetical protein